MNIETITYICDKLGWDYRFVNDEMIIIQHPAYIAALFVDATDMELITFAGVVKAEMAKRGWNIVPVYDQHEKSPLPQWYMRAWKGAGDVLCRWNKHDPTDPICEAEAICEAAKEALMMEESC